MNLYEFTVKICRVSVETRNLRALQCLHFIHSHSLSLNRASLTRQSNTFSPYRWGLSSKIPNKVSSVSCKNYTETINCYRETKKVYRGKILCYFNSFSFKSKLLYVVYTLTISVPSMSFSLERQSMILSGWTLHFSRSNMSPENNIRNMHFWIETI